MIPIPNEFAIKIATQPPNKAAAAIVGLASDLSYSRVRIAAAYASELGVLTLDELLSTTPVWKQSRKNFLVSIDNGITQPDALARLASLPDAEVRVPGATKAIKNPNLRNSPSFHAKCYCFDVRRSKALSVGGLIVGSNNLTNAGLESNAELAVVLKSVDVSVSRDFNDWWSAAWASADPLTGELLEAYRKKRIRTLGAYAANLPEGELSPTELGNAKSLWIKGGFLSGGASNQLELPQGVAAFFGLAPGIKGETINFQLTSGKHSWDSWIKFWGNGVWRLRLPTAAQGGPPFSGTLIRLDRSSLPNSYILHTSPEESASAEDWLERSERRGGIQSTMKGSRGRIYGWF